VFGVTANMVALYAKVFERLTPLKTYELHSRLNQNTRTRTTEEFKAAETGIMFASDVIGRGMDFPNVTLVIQVGLPSNGEQYVHRVGRTARAGNDGQAIIMLTQNESFFLAQNRQLPITPHVKSAEIVNNARSCAEQVEQRMYTVDEDTKKKAYSSFLGFFAGSGLMKPLRLDKPGLVAMANSMALEGMHCPEPPPMEKTTVGKMGLKGIPGLNYAAPENSSFRPRPPQKRRHDNNFDSFSHEGYVQTPNQSQGSNNTQGHKKPSNRRRAAKGPAKQA
jgi:ATP-dependent RNA helicase MSS116